MKNIYLTLSLVLIAILGGCGNPPMISEQNARQYTDIVVTADNGYSLTLNGLYQELYNSKKLRNGGVMDTTYVRTFLDSLVVDTLVGFAADTIPLEENYIEHRLYKLRYHDALIKKYLKTFVYDQVDLDSQKITEFYTSRPDLFAVKEQVSISHILVSSLSLLRGPDSLKYKAMTEDQLDEEVKKFAWEIRSQITDSLSFATAAREYSEDLTSGNIAGYVGWIPRDTYMPPFDSIAFEMRNGDISDPYKDNSGWHILYCSGYYEEGIPPLNEQMYQMASKTYATMQSNIIGKQLLDTLFVHKELVYNDSLMDKDPFQLDGQLWLAVVNGLDTIDINEARSIEMNYRQQYSSPVTTPDMKKEMLGKLAEKYIILQAARKNSIDTLPEMIEQEYQLRHKYQRVVIENDRYDPEWVPSDSIIEAYYNQHTDEFLIEKPLTVQHIVVEDSVFGEYLRDLAMSGYDFLDLAEEHYPGDDEAIRRELADLGPIGPGDMPDAFYQAALHVPVGEVTRPVKTEFGYHIIKVLKNEESEDLSKARHKIMSKLKREHKQQTFDTYKNMMYKQYGVQFPSQLYPMHLKPLKLRLASARDTTASE